LIPLVGVELLLDLALSGSEETIAEQGDEEGEETNDTGTIAVTTVLLSSLSITKVEDNDTSGNDETAEVLALAVLSLSTEDEGDNKDRDDLG